MYTREFWGAAGGAGGSGAAGAAGAAGGAVNADDLGLEAPGGRGRVAADPATDVFDAGAAALPRSQQRGLLLTALGGDGPAATTTSVGWRIKGDP